MAAAGVGVYGPGESPGTHEEALEAVKLAFEAAAATSTPSTRTARRRCTVRSIAAAPCR